MFVSQIQLSSYSHAAMLRSSPGVEKRGGEGWPKNAEGERHGSLWRQTSPERVRARPGLGRAGPIGSMRCRRSRARSTATLVSSRRWVCASARAPSKASVLSPSAAAIRTMVSAFESAVAMRCACEASFVRLRVRIAPARTWASSSTRGPRREGHLRRSRMIGVVGHEPRGPKVAHSRTTGEASFMPTSAAAAATSAGVPGRP